MRFSTALVGIGLSVSMLALADDISNVPKIVLCSIDGVELQPDGTARTTEKKALINYLSMPPLRSEVQSLSDDDLACLYVAGWRERAVYGDNFASEKLCYARTQDQQMSVFACQVVGHRDSGGRYQFDNMDCENGELDRISLNKQGVIISSDFASSRDFESHSKDFFLGQGNCQIRN